MISVKEFIDLGGEIKVPYKGNDVLEWFSHTGVSISYFDGKYHVYHPKYRINGFDSFDNAWKEFDKYRFNIGVLQGMVQEEDYKREDIEDNPEWWRRKIEEKADELGVPRPKWKSWDDEREEWIDIE